MPSYSFARAAALLLLLAVPAKAADSGSDSGSQAAAPATAPASGGITEAQAAIDAGQYAKALRILAPVAKAEPKNADVWNLMGYSSRNLKNYNEAARYYAIALRANPKHIGALEYQGELFVETGQFDQARQNLKMLQSICGTCEEAMDLQSALQAKGQG
ncbi:MAG: tetratricopeptide repeat protein [Proteobacteria bacterium]|nr:tetratricopeptide repeat protein [Pseudomonadota bacterium]